MNRPHTTVVLAMSADGKIADAARSPARFSSKSDRAHLEGQIARVDGLLFGAGTLRAYGSSLPITTPQLLQQRSQQNKPPQPVHIVCSRSGNLDPQMRFFRQPIPRWLLTAPTGAQSWQGKPHFANVLAVLSSPFDWNLILAQLHQLGLDTLAILGGGELVASLLELNLIDELWLTICPILLGGATAPTPVEGMGFSAEEGRQLKLLSATPHNGEIFLHYRLES